MSFLGLETGKSAPGYRIRRFSAFLIDVVIVLVIINIVFSITGIPDFPSVKAAMDAAGEGASGPNAQLLADNMFNLFNTAYWQTLMIWFAYEVLTQLAFKGATLGKLVMRLKVVSINPNRNRILHNLLLIVRSAIKFIFLYLLQGFPFLIAVLSVFADKQSRAGYDIFVKTYVKDVRRNTASENIDKLAINER